MPEMIEPDWPAPARVKAYSTTRAGGVGTGVYASLNLGDHVGDAPERVARNRAILREHLQLPSEPLWLRQVHGCALAGEDAAIPGDARTPGGCEADGAVTSEPGVVCVVMTADCLPVLMCDDRGTRVAAVHAGWRGLASGILERAIAAMGGASGRNVSERILVWLGPAIGPDAFEVGPEVRARFLEADPASIDAFRASRDGRFLADLAALARRRLARIGVTGVYGGGYCTHSDPRRFFSYRRDGVTGRMASLIWLDGDGAAAGDTHHA
ncbi:MULTISPECIES: peptidoglycan editing factor PgeF [unclassified Thiocapsa]|uniref:peptidoglycan editing factor PgeF n=1 Tax=unclassified Thiocapsa TaxID=2641286 RepID=UPI0035B4AE7A